MSAGILIVEHFVRSFFTFFNFLNSKIFSFFDYFNIFMLIGLFLKDITYIIEGNQPMNCIELFGEQMVRLKQFRKTQFRFPLDEDLRLYILNLQGGLGEDDLYNISLEIQPIIDPEDEKKSTSAPFLFRSPLTLRKSASNLHKLHSPKKKEKEEKPRLQASPVASRTKSHTTNDSKPSLIRSLSRRARSFVHSENDSIGSSDEISAVISSEDIEFNKVEKCKRSHQSFLNFFGVGR